MVKKKRANPVVLIYTMHYRTESKESYTSHITLHSDDKLEEVFEMLFEKMGGFCINGTVINDGFETQFIVYK